MEKDLLAGLLAQGLSLEQIGERVRRHPSTVAYWLRKHGLAAVHGDKHAARGVVTREALEALVDAGQSTRAIAEEFDVSQTTVRHWLKKFGLLTVRSRRLRAARVPDGVDLPQIVQAECRHHGLTDFWLEGRGVHRCRRCRWEAVTRHRRKVKRILVREAGGRCVLCGYEKFVGALHFHHLDPRDKEITLGAGLTHGLARQQAEARKCALLCANCHAEVEGGVAHLDR